MSGRILNDMDHNLDINWYFVDRYMHLICVASGGGKLPEFIAESMLKNDSIHSTVVAIDPLFDSERNPNLGEYINLLDIDAEQYYSTFDLIACRGFYVFDKVDISNPEDKKYVLVAYPKRKYPTRMYSPILHYLLFALIALRRKDSFKKYKKISDQIPVFDAQIIRRSHEKSTNLGLVNKPIDIVNIVNSARKLFQ